ncbi:MAG: hypothetical protein CMQ24_00185 [Gammaproteobacteria bacterium]|nr:hypothetical protein [Gammaproteobacteria bacterium]
MKEAKLLLINHLEVSDSAAHLHLIRDAMNQNERLRDIARRVVAAAKDKDSLD